MTFFRLGLISGSYSKILCLLLFGEIVWQTMSKDAQEEPWEGVAGLPLGYPISRRSKGSSASLHARRIEVKASSARLKAEKELFDREIECKRFYLEKEIAMNAAEEAVDQLVMEENTEVKSGKMCNSRNKAAEIHVAIFENMPSKLEPEPLFENPSGYTIRQPEVQPEILFMERLINIQDKQMELTAQLVN